MNFKNIDRKRFQITIKPCNSTSILKLVVIPTFVHLYLDTKFVYLLNTNDYTVFCKKKSAKLNSHLFPV